MMAGIEKVSIPPLGGDNWSIWKAKFQALLEYKDLMVAVEQPNSVEGQKASRQAKTLMILHTEDAYVKLIVGKSTAAKAWEKLKQNFEKKSNARVVQLTGKLTNMKLGEKQTIAEYLGEFREIKED
jgi:CRISPR/Cas system-associated protein endoribonuclease Cas2